MKTDTEFDSQLNISGNSTPSLDFFFFNSGTLVLFCFKYLVYNCASVSVVKCFNFEARDLKRVTYLLNYKAVACRQTYYPQV